MEKLKNVICCGEPVTIEKATVNEVEGYGIYCSRNCRQGLFGADREDIIKQFVDRGLNNVSNQNQRGLAISPNSMPSVFSNRKQGLMEIASPILSGDKSAMNRLMATNTERYPLTLQGKAWDKIWNSEEGKHSIVKGIEDALIMGAELGKMGDLVPMGSSCIFIPTVEAYEFTLTNGQNAPFENITIENIYEDDEVTSGRKNGSFFIDVIFGKAREKVVSVAVYGELKKSGIVVGEMYDAKRLLEKAELHSKPYANYMKYMKAYEYQKSEGKVQVDPNGREFFTYFETVDSTTDKYFDRSVDFFRGAESRGELKKDSRGEYALQKLPTFEKKIYRSYIEGGTTETTIFVDTLENPYAGADQPEMLRKTAGKSFLAKYAKVRNSEAAMHEVKNHKDAVKTSMDMADSQFDDLEGVVE